VNVRSNFPHSLRIQGSNPTLKAKRYTAYVMQSRRTHSGVLDIKHTVAGARQPKRNFLVPLPKEIPLDAGEVDDVSSRYHSIDCGRVD
jgi:hypothetical protein